MPKGQYQRVTIDCDKCELQFSKNVFQRHREVCSGPRTNPKKVKAILTSDQEKEIADRYYNGEGYRTLTKDYRISADRIIKILKKYGVVPRKRFEAIQKLSRETHACWNGGITKKVGKRGRVERFLRIWEDDPMYSMVDTSGYVREHRLVMARHIGRPLTKRETVHHIDGDTLNNDITNLQLRSKAHGVGQIRVCGDCGSKNVINIPLPEEN